MFDFPTTSISLSHISTNHPQVPSTAMTTSPGKKSKLTLSIPHFSSPCIRITDVKTHKKLGIIAFQPHTLDLPNLEAGTHELEITAFGNRYNSFGHFHAPLWLGGCGPGMWRSKSPFLSSLSSLFAFPSILLLELSFLHVRWKGWKIECEERHGIDLLTN